MKNFFFPFRYHGGALGGLLLALRLLFGVLFLTHGYAKLSNFETLSTVFHDPFGIGSELSLVLVILAEFFCSIGFIFGFLFRLALLPMIFTMLVAFFYAHGGSVTEGELSLIYLGIFLLTFFFGAGSYSVDNLICRGTCDLSD